MKVLALILALALPAESVLELAAARRDELTLMLAGAEGLSVQLAEVNATLDDLRHQELRLTEARAGILSKVEAAGFSEAISLQLRKQRGSLPDLRSLRRAEDRDRERISALQLLLLELEEERGVLDDVATCVADDLTSDPATAAQPGAAGRLEALYLEQKELLDRVLVDGNALFRALLDVDAARRQLLQRTEAFAEFIDEHVLWVRSCRPLDLDDAGPALSGFAWLLDPREWRALGAAVRGAVERQPLRALLAAVLLIGLAGLRPGLRRRLALASRPREAPSLRAMLGALFLALLVALAFPTALLLLSDWLGRAGDGSELARALSAGLLALTLAYVPIKLLRLLSAPGELGQTHFGWGQSATASVRRNLIAWQMAVLPALFLWAVMTTQAKEPDWGRTLGRVSHVAVLLTTGVFLFRILRPRGGLMSEVSANHPRGWLARLRWPVLLVAVGTPLFLAGVELLGYAYTAERLGLRLASSLSLVLVLTVLFAAARRWAGSVQAGAGLQAVRLLRACVAFALGLGLWLIWARELPALELLHTVELWSTQVQRMSAEGALETVLQPVTLAGLGLAVAIMVLTVIAARNVPGLLEVAVLRRVVLQPGAGYAITAVARYLLVIGGLVAAAGALGLRWSNVQWLAAAVTVGLGFGLQEIFANFVSGLILLFERPIRVGDVVHVGGVDGVVSRIRVRATTVVDWDRRELVIPNKDFITKELVNWSLSDPVSRLVLPVGVAYGSDHESVRRALLEAARAHPLVLTEPAPNVVCRSFGDSAVNYELRVFISDRRRWQVVTDAVNVAIETRLRAAGVSIPLPQRVVRLEGPGPA